MSSSFMPYDWQHTPRTKRGAGIGLGKPIRKDGIRVGSSHMVWDEKGATKFIKRVKQDDPN